MKAILINDDKSLRWDEVPYPVMGENECLLKISAAGVNRADLVQREGNYPPPAGCPEWMGLEISGEIIDISNGAKQNSDYKIGDKVCALLGGGGYAEYISVKYDMLMPVPDNCSMIEAAALPEAFATAYLNLFIEADAKKGETLFVTAGSSGLASVMIPMAKAFGLRVVTTVSSKEKAEKIKSLGADRIIISSEEDVPMALKEELANSHPIDIAIDCVGGKDMGKCVHYAKRGARWVMIASLGGKMTEISLVDVFAKNIKIIGSTLRSRSPEFKARLLKELVENVWDKVSSGEIKPIIYKVLPMQKAEEAQDILYKRENIGKVVLTLE